MCSARAVIGTEASKDAAEIESYIDDLVDSVATSNRSSYLRDALASNTYTIAILDEFPGSEPVLDLILDAQNARLSRGGTQVGGPALVVVTANGRSESKFDQVLDRTSPYWSVVGFNREEVRAAIEDFAKQKELDPNPMPLGLSSEGQAAFARISPRHHDVFRAFVDASTRAINELVQVIQISIAARTLGLPELGEAKIHQVMEQYQTAGLSEVRYRKGSIQFRPFRGIKEAFGKTR